MRADRYLVEKGFFKSRARAQAAIDAAGVRVNGRVVVKPSQSIPEGAFIEANPAFQWVSRSAMKLVAGLDEFAIDPDTKLCLDLGASTGGFTEVLLDRGAEHVYAIDVGHGQLDPDLRKDPRVDVLEKTDARAITMALFSRAPELIVCDVSFISLEKALPEALHLAAAGAHLVALFKPQFEVGRDHVGKGGIVTDVAAVHIAQQRFQDFLTEERWQATHYLDSPVLGSDGNQEFLIAASKSH